MPEIPDEESRRIRANLLRIHGQDIIRDTDGSSEHFDRLSRALERILREQDRIEKREGKMSQSLISGIVLGAIGLFFSGLTWLLSNIHFGFGGKP